jgi:hypothetical protein
MLRLTVEIVIKTGTHKVTDHLHENYRNAVILGAYIPLLGWKPGESNLA